MESLLEQSYQTHHTDHQDTCLQWDAAAASFQKWNLRHFHVILVAPKFNFIELTPQKSVDNAIRTCNKHEIKSI